MKLDRILKNMVFMGVFVLLSINTLEGSCTLKDFQDVKQKVHKNDSYTFFHAPKGVNNEYYPELFISLPLPGFRHDFFQSRDKMLELIESAFLEFRKNKSLPSEVLEKISVRAFDFMINYFDEGFEELNAPNMHSVRLKNGYIYYYRTKFDKATECWEKKHIFTETYEEAIERQKLPRDT